MKPFIADLNGKEVVVFDTKGLGATDLPGRVFLVYYDATTLNVGYYLASEFKFKSWL